MPLSSNESVIVERPRTNSRIFAHTRWDAIPVAAALLHIYSVSISWNINGISHNFIHNLYFRAPLLNRLFSIVALAFGVSSCTPAKPVAEADYGVKIVGNWLGTVGNMKESITFNGGGSFIAQLRPQGFISNTLSQGVTGTIRGTWAINGKTITLKITSAEDERVKNSVTSSTILAFNQDELSMKNDRGETSTFTRAISL